ncbi:MAG: nuclear transport factor 2 family protein [Massilia sp.]
MNVRSELVQQNLHAIFGEHDAFKRRQRLEAIWHPDGLFIDPDGSHHGIDAIEARVIALQAQFPDFVFSELGAVQQMHEVARLGWAYGPADAPRTVTGIDVAVSRDGKLVALYAFIDG